MKKFRITSLLAVLTLGVAACGGGSEGGDAAGGVDTDLVIAFSDIVSTFDPPDVGDNPKAEYLQPVYDTITQLLPDGSVGPRVATAWEYTDATNTTLRMTLSDDVTFSDGTKLDAEAVKANLEHFLTGTGPAVNNIKQITAIDVVDPTTLELHLSAPIPALMTYFGKTAGMLVSPAVLDAPSLDTTPVGSGPYELDTERTVVGSSYVYTRRSDYWNASDYPYDTITLNYIVDPTARLNAVRTGQADSGAITTKTAAEAEGAGLQVQNYSSGDVLQLDLMDRAGTTVPALADARVRQAMNYAIDRESIIKTLYDGKGTLSTQIFNPDSTAWVDDLNDSYTYDPAKAEQLLAEAGYADGFSITLPEITTYSDVTAVLAQEFGDVGITVNTTKVPDAQAVSEARSGKFPATVYQLQSNDPWQAIQLMVQPTAAWNPLQYADPEVDDLLARAQSATDADRPAAYQELNSYLVDQAWFAPIVFTENVVASGDSVTVTPYTYLPLPPIEGYAPAGS